MDFHDDNTSPPEDGNSLSCDANAPITAADAMRLIETWTDLKPTRRRDLRSAVSCTVAMCGLPAGAVFMTPQFLSPRIMKRTPAGFDQSDDRHSAVLSGLRFVLRRLGVLAPFKVELPPDWRMLRDHLSSYERIALAAWLRFVTVEGIGPTDIEASAIDSFETWVREHTLCENPKQFARRTAKAWNRAVATISGWPQVRLEWKPVRDQYALPFEAYPESFGQDVEAWARRAEQAREEEVFPDDIADRTTDGACRSPKAAKPRTVKTRTFQIRQAAGALVRSGVAPADIGCLADLVTPHDRPKAILTFMRSRGREQRSANAGGVGEVLRQIAKYWARLPDDEVRRIALWASRVAPASTRGMTKTNRERLRALTEPRTCAKLLHLPRHLETLAQTGGLSARRSAIAMQRAVAVEMATICPLRVENLATLRLDEHLKRADPASRLITHLSIDGSDVKNSEPYLWPIPRETALMLDRWLTRYRPTLAAPGNTYLFVGESASGPISINGLRQSFTTSIERHVGVWVNPHLMRHFAAWLHLQAYPGDYETVRRALNHRSITTTTSIYCGLETDAAVRRFDQVVLTARKKTRRLAATAFKKRRSPRPRLPKPASPTTGGAPTAPSIGKEAR